MGAAQAYDQRSLITPEARGHHEVIMRSSQAGGVTWSRQTFNVNDNSVAGQASALRVFDYTRCRAKTGHCGDEAHELSRAVTRQ